MILTSNKGSHQIRLNIQQEQMEISSEDLDFGMAGKESLPVNYNGNPMALGFNAEYTLEVVNNLKADSVVIYLSDPSRPALIEPAEQPEGCRVTVLLMTMQLLS